MTPALPNFYSEDEMCALLKIKRATLRGRIASGTGHPPPVKPRPGVYFFNKQQFEDWLSSLPLLTEVKRGQYRA